MSNWRPLGIRWSYRARRPVVGSVVALHHRAWEVTHVSHARPLADTTEGGEGRG